jgi:lysophospholipase L1-like esterase
VCGAIFEREYSVYFRIFVRNFQARIWFDLTMEQPSMRIVFLGASLTEGIYGGNYVDRVAHNLPDHEIINLGRGGSTMNRLVARLEDVMEQEADAAFILAGSNDAIAYSQPKTRPYYRQSQDLPEGYLTPEAFGQLYRDFG